MRGDERFLALNQTQKTFCLLNVSCFVNALLYFTNGKTYAYSFMYIIIERRTSFYISFVLDLVFEINPILLARQGSFILNEKVF